MNISNGIHHLREVCWFTESQSEGQTSFFGINNTIVVRNEKHATLEEVGLDKRQVLKVLQGHWCVQQLPLVLVGPVAVDQLFWVSQEIEVIIFIHLERKKPLVRTL